jgi:RNA polymerase sporulation-specific sigma factor
MDYKNYNDFELLYLIGDGNEDANDIIYKKYKPVIELKAKKYYNYSLNKGLEYNDLVQEGMIGLSEAIKDFKDIKDVKFSTFASLCIERQISSVIIAASRKKYKLLNDSISLDYVDDDVKTSLMDYIADEKEMDPLEKFINAETELEVLEKIKDNLTDFENQVLELKLNNFNYKEIAEILDKSIKSIDNALQRIKTKVKNIIKTVVSV